MKTAPVMRRAGDGDTGMPGRGRTPTAAANIGLWFLIMVLSVLFTLLLFAYVIRMSDGDWRPLALPSQLWLNTGVLILGSVALQHAAAVERRLQRRERNLSLLASGVCGIAFVIGQLWAWQQLIALNEMVASNPSNSFFYLLTGLHGMHVIGGLIALAWCSATAPRYRGTPRAARGIALCARYWHFILLVWLVLFSAMLWITPEIAQTLCGVRTVN